MFDMIVRALFTDVGLSAGIAKVNSRFEELKGKSPVVKSEIRALETGFRTLTFSALGATGPIGRVAEAFGRLGGGSALVLGATAGIAAIGLAWKMLNKAGDDAAKATEDNLTRMRKAFKDAGAAMAQEGAVGLAVLNQRVLEAQAKVQAIRTGQEQFVQRTETVMIRGVGPEEVPVGPSPQEQRVNALTAATNTLNLANQALNDGMRAAAEAGDKATDKYREQADALERGNAIRVRALELGLDESTTNVQLAVLTAQLAAEQLGLNDASTRALVTQARRVALLNEEKESLDALLKATRDVASIDAQIQAFLRSPEFARGMAEIQPFPSLEQLEMDERLRQQRITRQELTPRIEAMQVQMGIDPETINKFVKDAIRSAQQAKIDKEAADRAGAAMASAFVSGVTLLAQGTPGGVLGGFGALATGASQLPAFAAQASFLGPLGIGLSAFGALVSLFDSGAERRHREELEELRAIRQNTTTRGEPQRTSVTILLNGKEISGALVEDVVYQIRRLERRNAVPVLPPQ